jgi:hypothetical protein
LALLAAVATATGPTMVSVPARLPAPDSTPDSVYATPALRALVTRVAVRNGVVPRGLESYRVAIESELSSLLRRSDGTEGATQIEQVETVARWQRSGAFTQRVIGYRSRLSGINISALTLLKQAWAVPLLYGNRLALFLGQDTTRRARRAAARDSTVRVVHPFGRDREAVYRYSGGDTALTIRVNGRTIPVARIHVVPGPHPPHRVVIFEGDVFVDMQLGEIVRMRGAFEIVGGHRKLGARLEAFAVEGVAFIDLTNREVNGQYWLPSTQRLEAEIGSPVTGDTRSVLRIISRFGDYRLNDSIAVADSSTAGVAPAPAAVGEPTLESADSSGRDSSLATDRMRVLPHTLTFAPADSVSGFAGWRAPIGEATTSVRVDDFSSVTPDRWRPTGPPRVEFGTQRLADFVHFDRVEGLFTGLGASLRLRDAAPGVVIRANAGWAWAEQTARGGTGIEWTHGSWVLGAAVARTLDNTNDFRTAFTGGPLLESLIVQDDYDYVDRRTASVYTIRRWLGASDGPGVMARFEGGVGEDAGDRARLTHGIFAPGFLMSDSLFRPNRTVRAGSYLRAAFTLDLHPGVAANFVQQGVGAQLHYEVAGGTLAWQRAELRVAADRAWGPLTILARLDAGIVGGTVIPPQQLFEIGSTEGLLAYNYKQFGGDRAVVWQGEGLFALPFWDAPLRAWGLVLPSPSPAVAIGFQSGWADASTVAARRALPALGARVDPATNAVLHDSAGTAIPVSSPTHGVRTSIDIILRFFGGAAGLGVAHSLDAGAKLQAVVRLGAAL